MRPKHLIEHYTTVGTIAGGSSAVVRALCDGNSPFIALVLGAVAGALGGALYGYIKLRRAAHNK